MRRRTHKRIYSTIEPGLGQEGALERYMAWTKGRFTSTPQISRIILMHARRTMTVISFALRAGACRCESKA